LVGRLSLSVASAQSLAPIALTGYNTDIVTDANKAVRFATPDDIGTADWFEAGAVDDGGTRHEDGLTAGSFASAFTNSVTGGHTLFQFQPFDGDNVLLMRYSSSNTGTLHFVTPGAYNTLAILASGYNASPTDQGTFVINFTDGTSSQPLPYNAFDWGFGQSNIALGDRGRNYDSGPDGTSFNYNKPVPFAMYETDLNLAALGLNTKPISSLFFTGGTVSDQPGVPNHGPSTSIFGVSGVAVPEPGCMALLTTGSLCGVFFLRSRRTR
jgi:hypothetical protein